MYRLYIYIYTYVLRITHIKNDYYVTIVRSVKTAQPQGLKGKSVCFHKTTYMNVLYSDTYTD